MKIQVMNVIKLLLLMLSGIGIWLLVSCATTNNRTIAIEFRPYVKMFEDLTDKKASKLSIKFTSFDKKIVGFCNLFTNSVLIDASYWFKWDKKRKTEIIFHELTHCLCYFGHDKTTRKDGCAKSIMYPTRIKRRCLELYWSDYMRNIKEICK